MMLFLTPHCPQIMPFLIKKMDAGVLAQINDAKRITKPVLTERKLADKNIECKIW